MKKDKPNVIVVGHLRPPAPAWCRFSRIAACLLLAVRLALLVANGFGYSVFLNGIPQGTVLFFYDGLLLFSLVFSIRWKRKAGVAFLLLIVALLLFLYGMNLFSYAKDKTYTEISSPGGTHTLIVEEDAYLFSGRCRFYRKENFLFIRNTGAEIQMDDGYQSFRENPRQLIWLDEDVAEFIGHAEGQEPGGTRITIRLQ